MKYQIPVYRAEVEAGVADAIRAEASLRYEVPAEAIDGPPPRLATAAEEPAEDTLFYFRDILATVGWNKNGDVFLPEPTWAARHTSDDKPLNLDHDRTDVIGHIVSSYAVDGAMEPIDEASAIEDLPPRFHLVNGTVIYRIPLPKNDAEQARSELIERTIAEIRKGEWYVSMECLFRGFDYALIDPEGVQYAVARTEQTAGLSKYLRAYPPDPKKPSTDRYLGTGTFRDTSGKEYQIGRMVRNITFTGKGLVRKPANPDSVIFRAVASFVPVADDSVYLKASTEPPTEPPLMSDATPETATLQRRLDEALAAVASLTDQNDALRNRDTEARIAGLEADARGKLAEAASLNSQLDAIKEGTVALTARAEAAEASLSAARDELSALKAVEVVRSRVATLVGLGAELAKAESLASKLTALDDAAFAETAEVLSASFKPAAPATVAAEIKAIDDAVPVPDAGLAAASEQAVPAGTATADWFSSILKTAQPRK